MTWVKNMGFADSIRSNLTYNSMLNEIRLLLSVPQNKFKTVILVEGQSDIKLLVSLFDMQNTYLIESFSGKSAILETMSSRFKDDRRVIGIIDRDYSNALPNKIFTYDFCNLEMMIISNNDSFNYTMFQITNSVYGNIEVREQSLNKLFILSVIRKLNDENDWGINFERFPIYDYSKRDNYISLEWVVRILNIKNKTNNITEEKLSIIKQELKDQSKDELYNITNGHDFCKMLLHELKLKYSSLSKVTSINVDELELFLIMGYNLDYFKKTKLYESISEYQVKNSLKIVKSY